MYTGSQLASKSMTLYDLERQNRVFMDFLAILGCDMKRIASKSIEIDIEKLHMKFSALNVDFDGPSLDFVGSRKPTHECIKEQYPCKRRYFTIVGQSFVKTVANRHGHAAYHNKLDELFSHINISDFERAWISKIRGFYWFLQSSAAAHTLKMNCNEMAGDRLTVCEQALL